MVDDRARQVGRADRRARLVVANRVGRHGVRDVGRQQPNRSKSRRQACTATNTSPSFQAQGLSDEEILQRTQARDNEFSSEASEVRYMVYALDAATGQGQVGA